MADVVDTNKQESELARREIEQELDRFLAPTIWVVAFNDNDEFYIGTSALFTNEEDAKKCFEEEKKNMKETYKDNVDFWDEYDTEICGYADPYANETICSLCYFARKLDGSWDDNPRL